MEFWNDFWPNFASSIAAGVIFSFFIAFIVQQIRRPKLKIALSVGTGMRIGNTLNFYCVNEGSVGLMPNEIQWHIYFDSGLKPDDDFEPGYRMFFYEEKSFNHISGMNKESCLPGSSIKLVAVNVTKNKSLMEFNGDFGLAVSSTYYYSLSTIKGQKRPGGFSSLFKKRKYIDHGSFVKREIFEITEKVQ